MRNNGNTVKDILFDLGNVLVPFDWNIAFQRLEPLLPTHFATLLTQDKPAFRNLFHEHSLAMEVGAIDFEGFRRIVSDILHVPLEPYEFRTIWCDIFTMDDDMVALGENLSKRYRTWLVSNTSMAHYQWIVEHFPRVVFYRGAALSFELGVMKPSPVYYEKTMKMFGVDPRSSVFIDDISENVQGAEKFGIRGIQYIGHSKLVAELHRIGVSV